MNLFRREGRRRRLPVVAFAGVLFAFQAIALVGAQTASAAFATCTFSGGVISVTLGPAQVVSFSEGASEEIWIDGANTTTQCASTTNATLSNTTAINVTGNTGDEGVVIDLGVDWGTINWSLNLLTGTGDFVDLDGSGITTVNGFTSADALDLVVGVSGVDLTNDGDLDATITGVEEIDVEGSEFDDTISGGGSDITGGASTIDMFVAAGTGDDWLVSGAGNDTLDGEAGEDTVDYSGATTAVNVNLVSDIASGMGVDSIPNDEDVYGSAQGDTITGVDGEDNYLTPAGGDDTVDCGGDATDEDTVDFSDSAAGVVVDLDAGTATGDGTDTISNCEDVQGSDFPDTISGDDNDNALYGGAGNDILAGGAGGGDGADILDGESGSDWVNYSLETDPVTVDLTTVAAVPLNGLCGDPADFDDGVSGEDCVANVENATLTTEDDTFIGNGFSNTVQPNGGSNSLTGGTGSDTLDYSVGYDAGVTVNLAGGSASDDAIDGFENVIGTAFKDNITGSDGSNTIKSRKGKDNVRAGGGDDTVKAGAGNDLVRGGTGDDDLWGQKGNDKINGGKGTDFCKGGPGKDTLKSCEQGHK